MSKTLGKWRGNALLAAAFVGLPLNALAADILYSLQSDRSNSINLDQGNFSPESSLYIFLGVESNAGISNVQFFLDDPDRLGSPFQREGLFPYDFRGGSNAAANSFSLSQLSAGPHTITSQTTFSDGSLDIVTASFTIDTSTENPDRDGDGVLNIDDIFPDDALEWADLDADGIGDNSDPDIDGDGIENSADDFPTDPTRFEAPNYEIGFSFSPDRSASMPLNAAQFEGTENIYAFLDVPTSNDVTRVYFYVNSPDLSGQWLQSEGLYPYDLRGGATNAANPFDTATLAEGDNTISARVLLDDGTTIETHATFTIAAFEPDSDGDGVPDIIDQCPDSNIAQSVDSNGCTFDQRDDDGDGVPNGIDQCPGSDNAPSVDPNGCSFAQIDDDLDGVPNGSDLCPDTPPNNTPDSQGCTNDQRDDDGDGVPNGIDLCPGSDNAPSVDPNGCSFAQIDDDLDGIPNGSDLCPDTPPNNTPDIQGCTNDQRDDDGDGVPNGIDLCPGSDNAPSVDTNGCSFAQIDDDLDGVPNGNDRCPDSDGELTVDVNGCNFDQLDEDLDGVANGSDLCPETPANSAVDNNGCSEEQLDSDHDGVSDASDLCPGTGDEGVTAYGCGNFQDEDGDFIHNEFDVCPFTPGLAELHGCQPVFGDFDNDGIDDLKDQCPYSVGGELITTDEFANLLPHEFEVDSEGCSSFDRSVSTEFTFDGTERGLDKCPSVFHFNSFEDGTFETFGCTEAQLRDDDFDGIINGQDACPDRYGKKLLNGCPLNHETLHDADFDGVPNEIDACPESPDSQFESVGPNGCLTERFESEDTDRDGVKEFDDQCPNSPLGHVVNERGCTQLQETQLIDEDQDGVADIRDLCIDTFAPPGSDGEHINHFGCSADAGSFGKDVDSDGIPNDQDACPEFAGTLDHRGCPSSFSALDHNVLPSFDNGFSNAMDARFLGGNIEDHDNDGHPDQFDQCHFSKFDITNPPRPSGILEGCFITDLNDDDFDGVINGQDRCPNTQDQEFLDAEGCNDWQRLDLDGDHLINGEDHCPTVYGRWQHNGCAENIEDADKDGVPNERDQCPLTPGGQFGPFGPVNFETGCTDREFEDDDLDNVPNIEDRCPNTPFGTQVFQPWHDRFEETGCSFEQLEGIGIPQDFDRDQDGIEDIFDLCPDTPQGANVDHNGCHDPFADDDRDGVPNIDDQCQNSRFARPMAFTGCELITAPVVTQNITLKQLPPFSPENPNGPQEHELQLSSLITWPEGVEGEAQFFDAIIEIDDKFRDFIDFFQFSNNEVFIHVRPELREMTLRIPAQIFIPELGQRTNWFEIIISPNGADGNAELGSLIVNDVQLLNDSDFGIRFWEVFVRLSNGASFEAGRQLFRQFWDSQRSQPITDTPFFCRGEMNGFPIVCDRPETDVVFMGQFDIQREMDFYTLTAVVNRMDLRRGNWDDCGEHRLVFAAQNHPAGRKFFIFEARLPNPTPGDIRGCEAPIRFWQDMAQLQGFEKADRIRRFFIDGDGMPPVISAPHFFHEAGQIRTNQFLGGEWLLKEHKLVDTCAGPRCGIFAETVSVKENPFGELFNPDLPFMPSLFAQQAAMFQDRFLDAIDDLAGEFFGTLKMTTPDEFNHGQSHSSGIEAEENDFRMHFFRGSPGSPFENDINFNLQGRFNADGSPLQVDQVLARAAGLTCGGCHNPDQLGLTIPGAIGSMRMPDGSIIDSWPRSNDFVHIDETGRLSPALQDVFLPIRQAGFGEIIEEFNQSLNF